VSALPAAAAERPPGAGRTLIAGIGNIFLGDDGFGVAVAQCLCGRELPPEVRAADFGIRGVHLAFEILDLQPALTILVDAASRGGAPGTLYVIEPDLAPRAAAPAAGGAVEKGAREGDGIAVADAHGMSPDAVLQLLARLGASPGRLLVVGCEPQTVEEGIGLSAPVAAAVEEAVRLVLELVRPVCQDGGGVDGAEAGAAPAAPAAPNGGGARESPEDLETRQTPAIAGPRRRPRQEEERVRA
jgi:hydrogenase maturation protease